MGCIRCFQSFLSILFSVVLGRLEVVLVVEVASNCFTLFLFVLDRSDGFRMFPRASRLFTFFRLYFSVLHIVKSDSDSFNFSG